ncbi:hypothetical protein LIER_28626 [Lithospermum erythrorhizon]|uniref:Uncharacterized protein n=1 Tax=Lithospermum erythrorhizon TaxID=34254 RepID=A0AAV3RKM9_LITER
MERTSTITKSLMVVFVLVLSIINEVEADSACMSKCNNKCLQEKKANNVSCGVACFVECLDWGNKKVSPEMQAKLADLKQRAKAGSMSQQDVQGELREIAKQLMVVSETKAHDHDKQLNAQNPVNAPKDVHEDGQGHDITDDDDVPN